MKTIKLFITVIQFVIALALVVLCTMGIIKSGNFEINVKFVGCILRCICIALFTLFYHHSLVGGFGIDTFFIPLHLLFSTLAEIRILNTYSEVFHVYYLLPPDIVNIFVFSSIMSVLQIIGYCVFYDSLDTQGTNGFIFGCFVGGIIITALMPKTQNLNTIWHSGFFTVILYSIYILATVICLFMLVTDTPGQFLIRHVITLILVAGNYINLFYDTFIMNLIGTAFLIVASVIIVIMTKHTEIRM